MGSGPITRALATVAVLSVVAACGPDDARRISCEHWLSISVEQRLVLADRVVSPWGEQLERIRIRQHRAPGTPRNELIRDVEGSLTKNCEISRPRTRTVGEVFDALYG